MKIHLVGTELFHADGERRTGRHDVDLRNFIKAPKINIRMLIYPLRTIRIRVI
jgi:hypothetical protein